MRRIEILTAVLLISRGLMEARGAESLQDRLQNVKPGQTVQLPAGEFRGGVTLPEGVSLQGAGYGKTTIDANGAENGLVVHGGTGATISDLTVQDAAGANVLVEGAANITLRRVRVSGGLIGVSAANSRQCRVENVVADANRYGLVIAGGENNVVVNCTLAGNTCVGLSLPSGQLRGGFQQLHHRQRNSGASRRAGYRPNC